METKSQTQVARRRAFDDERLLARVSSLPLLRTPQPSPAQQPLSREAMQRPEAGQEVIAPAVVAELTLWADAYVEQVGHDAPHPSDLAEAFTMADGWGREAQKARAWLAYAEMQRATAWDVVMTLAGELAGPFEVARHRDMEIALRFPALTRFFGLQERGLRKAARRARRAKESVKLKETTGTPPTQA